MILSLLDIIFTVLIAALIHEMGASNHSPYVWTVHRIPILVGPALENPNPALYVGDAEESDQ